jgi:predicted CXXCH cytochrome family protein
MADRELRNQRSPIVTGAVVVSAWLVLLSRPGLADESVMNSKHDLSAFGPGSVRAVEEDRVCIFCHTPHRASGEAPLWNRFNPRTHYRIYDSSTTDARIDQPSGSSKLCLSCHDGSIALGLVRSREPTEPIQMTHPFMPANESDLTNDLSDDHPIGLRFDRQLSNRDSQIRSPDLVDHRIPLGPRGELQCTACHDPHNNELGDFLRITNREGALCTTCHDMSGWRRSSHARSSKSVPATVTNGERQPFRTMRDNACLTCHRSHGAPNKERLLRGPLSEMCVDCHDGITGRDILAATGQRSGHLPRRVSSRHDPTENPMTMRPHVDCVDCHNPHAVRPNALASTGFGASTIPLALPPAMAETPGVSASGVVLDRARFYHEVCFRCHADNPVRITNRIVRQRDDQGNIRRQFQRTSASAHPITFSARAIGESPSLTAEARARRFVDCQDCHNNPDARQLGGGGANGPHGSRFPFLLARRYETASPTAESPQAYALCYDCHDRNSILGDESFPLHRAHVVRGRTSCSACHSPHGVGGSSAQHDNLINFDVSVVHGERFFRDTGRRSGSCTLTCHGVRHVNFTYGG